MKIFFCLLTASFLLITPCAAQTFEEARTRSRLEFEQKSLEMQRDFDRRIHEQKHRVEQSDKSASRFRASQAPEPEFCLAQFVLSAQKAESMHELLPFLCEETQERIKQEQAQYDPSMALEQRKRFRERNPELTSEELDHLTGPPYERSLNFYRGIAEGIVDVTKVKVKGDKAYLSLVTVSNAVIDEVTHPYRESSLVLVGEDNYWRILSYKDSDLHYRHLP